MSRLKTAIHSLAFNRWAIDLKFVCALIVWFIPFLASSSAATDQVSNQPIQLGSRLFVGAESSSEVGASASGLLDRLNASFADSKTRDDDIEYDSAPLAEDRSTDTENAWLSEVLDDAPENWTSREGLAGSIKVMLLMSVVSLAPAILLMTTCYVRIVVVLGLLRQALGANQLPPNQVMTSIALFITFFIMAPVWNKVYRESLKPYTAEDSSMTAEEAWTAGVRPVREFMNGQIQRAGNQEDIYLFYRYHTGDNSRPKYLEDVPLQVLLPAFMLSELKTAFLMGFMIFMPFLIIDLVVASVTISMGMMMLPPAMISLPFKLLLFVLVDGWRLVVDMLLQSFGPYQ